MEWQPIETAPMDGSFILAYCPYDGEYEEVPSIFTIRFNRNKYAKGWYLQTTEGDEVSVNPTHWMPMPDEPI